MSGEMSTKPLKREFLDKKTDMTLSDPNVAWTPNQVRDFYSNHYPHLVNASISGPKIGVDKVVYEFSGTAGVKG
jgi:PRTRC genetic system protein C